METVGGIYQ